MKLNQSASGLTRQHQRPLRSMQLNAHYNSGLENLNKIVGLTNDAFMKWQSL